MLITSSTIASSTWRGNAGQMPRILRENMLKVGVCPFQSEIINLKKLVKFTHRKDCQQLMKLNKIFLN